MRTRFYLILFSCLLISSVSAQALPIGGQYSLEFTPPLLASKLRGEFFLEERISLALGLLISSAQGVFSGQNSALIIEGTSKLYNVTVDGYCILNRFYGGSVDKSASASVLKIRDFYMGPARLNIASYNVGTDFIDETQGLLFYPTSMGKVSVLRLTADQRTLNVYLSYFLTNFVFKSSFVSRVRQSGIPIYDQKEVGLKYYPFPFVAGELRGGERVDASSTVSSIWYGEGEITPFTGTLIKVAGERVAPQGGTSTKHIYGELNMLFARGAYYRQWAGLSATDTYSLQIKGAAGDPTSFLLHFKGLSYYNISGRTDSPITTYFALSYQLSPHVKIWGAAGAVPFITYDDEVERPWKWMTNNPSGSQGIKVGAVLSI